MPRFATLLFALGATAASAGAQAAPAKRQRPKPFAELSASAQRLLGFADSAVAETPLGFGRSAVAVSRLRDSVVALSQAQLGTRYRLGASRAGVAFDCSGFVKWVMARLDLELPRTAHQQAQVGVEVPTDTAALRPGDVLTFGRGTRISHVGIYIGEGKFIHASSARRQVVVSEVEPQRKNRVRPLKGARRFLVTADADPGGSAAGPTG